MENQSMMRLARRRAARRVVREYQWRDPPDRYEYP